jgi:hypothetical protein
VIIRSKTGNNTALNASRPIPLAPDVESQPWHQLGVKWLIQNTYKREMVQALAVIGSNMILFVKPVTNATAHRPKVKTHIFRKWPFKKAQHGVTMDSIPSNL